MWQRIWTLIIKEMLAVWRDPKSRGIIIVPPLVEMFVFAFVATQEVKNVRIGVLNRDWGTGSRDLIARFEGGRISPRSEFICSDESEVGRSDRRTQRALGRSHPVRLLAQAGRRRAGDRAIDSRRAAFERGSDCRRLCH